MENNRQKQTHIVIASVGIALLLGGCLILFKSLSDEKVEHYSSIPKAPPLPTVNKDASEPPEPNKHPPANANNKPSRTTPPPIKSGSGFLSNHLAQSPISKLTDDGVKLELPSGSAPTIPQVRINFVVKNTDGSTAPAMVRTIELARADDSWAQAYGVDGHALQLAVGAAQDTRMLESGVEYMVRDFPGNLPFRVQAVPDGKIFQVSVTVNIPDKKTDEVEMPVNLSKLKLTCDQIPFDELMAQQTIWVALFHDGETQHNAKLNPKGLSIFELPKSPVGGELLVYSFNQHRAWSYIRSLKSDTVSFPGEATFRPAEDKSVKVELLLDSVDRGKQLVIAYADEKAHLPLVWLPPDPNHTRFEILLPPGEYNIRTTIGEGRNKREISLGRVSVEGPGKYKPKS